MKFDINTCPFIPFSWMKLKLTEDEEIYSNISPLEDKYIKISKGKCYSLTIKRDGAYEEIIFSLKESNCSLSELLDSSNLRNSNYTTAATVVPHTKLFASERTYQLSTIENGKVSVDIPSFFSVTLLNKSVIKFELQNMKFNTKLQKMVCEEWSCPQKSWLWPGKARVENLCDYNSSFDGIKHVFGGPKDVTLYCYNDANVLYKRETHYNTGVRCFYNALVCDALYFLDDAVDEDNKKLYAQMEKELGDIGQMNSRLADQGSAFWNFYKSWPRYFHVKTPYSAS